MLINHATIDELRNAKLLWLKSNQQELEDKEEFINIEPCFHFFKDKHGLLRLEGRIGNSSLPYN